MLSREKLRAYLSEKAMLDEIPSGFWIHYSKACQYGRESVKAHVEYYEKTQVPLTKVMNEHFFQLDRQIESPVDWKYIREKRISDTNYPDYLDEIRMFRKEMGKDAFILATIHGVYVSACHAVDGPGTSIDPNNTITRHLKTDPEAASTGLRAIGKTLEALCEACLKAGADGIYYAALGSEKERFIKQKGIVILHVCKSNPRLPMFQDYPAHAVNWAVHDSAFSLRDGVKLFPDMKILGGFDNRKGPLFDGNENAIADVINRAVQDVGRDKLMIGADCTLPTAIPTDHIHKAVKICESVCK